MQAQIQELIELCKLLVLLGAVSFVIDAVQFIMIIINKGAPITP